MFPGAAAAIALDFDSQRKRVISICGKTRVDKNGVDIEETFYFDLASLTKALATSLSLFILIDRNMLDWDDTYADVSRRKMPSDKKNITLAQLLSHSSGLSSYKPYFKSFTPCYDPGNKEKLIQGILKDSLAYTSGTQCLYSDLGFILLGDCIEKISNQPLYRFFQQNIARPMGLEKEMFFVPLDKRNNYEKSKFVATEHCHWRKKVLQGEVHDEHAFCMGGVAGHAGLFGTINGVIVLCEEILNCWQGRKNKLPVSERTIKKGLRKKYGNQTWSMGFDAPSIKGYSSAGKYMARSSRGHLGYSGTSFWMDPEQDVILVLLTNRVHPSRENKKIRTFRPWFHDQIMKCIFDK